MFENTTVVSSDEALKRVKKYLEDKNISVALEFKHEDGTTDKFILSDEPKKLLKACYSSC